MKIAIDISPLSSGHKVRGVGSYVSLIYNNIEKYDKKNTYVFFENEIPKNVDIVHYPYFDPFIPTLPRKKPKKVIVTVHDLIPIVFREHFPAGLKGNIRWFVQKQRLKNADLIISDSDSSSKDIQKHIGVSENKVKTVYLAADKKFKVLEKGNWEKVIRDKFKLPDKFVLYVGDATWNKNIPALINAVKKTNYKLVIVGKVWEKKLSDIEENPWNKDLKYILENIKDDNQFLNLGFVDTEALVKIYNLATLFVMPSIYEGFGLPVLEAMNSGCPVLSTRGGSLPEVGGSAAQYIEGFDSGSIADSINALLNDESARENLSKKGFEQSKKFSVEKMMRDLVNKYQQISE